MSRGGGSASSRDLIVAPSTSSLDAIGHLQPLKFDFSRSSKKSQKMGKKRSQNDEYQDEDGDSDGISKKK
eukprot:jgi/Bigna1/62856/fgenesh1_kg.43_\